MITSLNGKACHYHHSHTILPLHTETRHTHDNRTIYLRRPASAYRVQKSFKHEKLVTQDLCRLSWQGFTNCFLAPFKRKHVYSGNPPYQACADKDVTNTVQNEATEDRIHSLVMRRRGPRPTVPIPRQLPNEIKVRLHSGLVSDRTAVVSLSPWANRSPGG